MAQEKLNKFTINYLTEEQYAAAREAGTLNNNDFYCTSDDLANDGQNSSIGTKAVIIKLGDTTEEQIEKIISSVELYEDEVNGTTVRLAKNILYEYPDYGSYHYLRADGVDGSSLSSFSISFICIDQSKTYTINAQIYELDGVVSLNWLGDDKYFNPEVMDHLISSSTTDSLSANQGRILNEKIAALEARIAALESGQVNNVAVDPTDTTNMNLWIETD